MNGIHVYEAEKGPDGKEIKTPNMQNRYHLNRVEVEDLLQSGFTVEQINKIMRGDYPLTLETLWRYPRLGE